MNVRRHAVRRVVISLLVFAALLLFAALFSGDSTSPVLRWDWLQEHRHEFYTLKGLIAGAAVLLVIGHMNQVWGESMRWGRRLRYLALFWLITLVAAASVEQLQQDATVDTRNLGGLLGAVFLIVAMLVSIREERVPYAHDRRN